MKKYTIFIRIATLLMVCIPSQAGKIVTDSIKSNTLNAMRKYNVYLPNGFENNKLDRYPVLYLLHGLGDTYTAWAVKGGLQAVADELIRSGEMRPMVIIMPEAGGQKVEEVWNGYFNMPGWAYEDFFFNEFLPEVENKYQIIGDKKHRAISGLSMGGGGSIVYCQHHPDMFCACYAFSAWIEQMPRNDKGKRLIVATAVHENAAKPYLESLSEEKKNELATLKWFLDIGDDDFLLADNFALFITMRKANIPCELRVRDGIHNWEYWHTGLRTSLPFVSRNFEK